MLRTLFLSILAALSLGQFAVFAQIAGSKVYFFDILLGMYVVIGIFYYLITSKKFYFHQYLLLFNVFSVIAFFSLFWRFEQLAGREFLTAFSYFLRWFVYLQAANLTYNLVKDGLFSSVTILRGLVISAVFLSLAGFVQLLVLPDFTTLDPSLGWDPHKNRLASTFFDPNFTGGYLSMILILFFLTRENLREKFFSDRLSLAFLLTIFLAVFLTYSRSTWGMLGLAVLIYGWKRSKKIVLLAILIAFSAYFAVPRIQTRISGITDPADSAYFRLISWRNTLDIAKDNLLLGVGFNAFKKAQIDYGYLAPDVRKEHSATGSDSSFLLVLATTGIFGFLTFLAGYFLPLLKERRWFFATLLLPLFLQTQFINALFYPQIMFLWLLLMVFGDKWAGVRT